MTYRPDNHNQNYSYQNNDGHQGGYETNYGQDYNSGQLPKFDTKRLITNLVVLTVLAGIVAFAVIFLISALLNTFNGQGLPTAGESILLAFIAAVLGLLVGLIYIPVYGTGNENLYQAAVLALTIVGIVVYGLLGGLLDGDWNALKTLAVLICAAAIAIMAPRRIADAANY